jgi:hypothetical protein
MQGPWGTRKDDPSGQRSDQLTHAPRVYDLPEGPETGPGPDELKAFV